MAEAVGLIASLITIASLVIEGVKQAKSIYRAPDELKALQVQIEGLSCLLYQIQEQEDVSPCKAVTTILTDANLTFERLNRLIQVKLIKSVGGTLRGRRRAWGRNKGKVLKAVDALKEHRQNLAAVTSSKNLVAVARSEVTLASISKQIKHSDLTKTNIDTQLVAMRNILSNTHEAMRSQATSLSRILGSASFGQGTPLMSVEAGSACYPCSHQYVQAGGLNGEMSQNQWLGNVHVIDYQSSRMTDRTQGLVCMYCGQETSGLGAVPAPKTIIDTSKKFFPETYSVEQQIPRCSLIVTSSYEQEATLASKTNLYRIFFMKKMRNWLRLDILLEIPFSSAFWRASSASQGEFKTREMNMIVAGTSLPYSLLSKISKHLERTVGLEEETSLNLILSKEEDLALKYDQSTAKIRAKLNYQSFQSADALTFLDDLGCPSYCEQEVVQLEVLETPNMFLASVYGELVLETMFGRIEPSSDLLYTVKALHCVRDHPAFPKLVGVVVNESRSLLKSYLIEFPLAEHKIEQKVGNPLIPWRRREKWAKQLVSALAHLHSKGYVAGNLLNLHSPLIIDESDGVQLWFFCPKFNTGKSDGGYYPPEFSHLRFVSKSLEHSECPNITSKTDIWHLGMLLWLLAENKPRTHKVAACVRQKCSSQRQCAASHTDDAGLPPLPETIPSYYRRAVEACRAHSPIDRPAARELLKSFPETDEPLFRCTRTPAPEGWELERLRKGVKESSNCDQCREKCDTRSFFHCNVCNTSDFDICHKCFAAGKHCHQDEHLLVELKKIGGWKVPWRYHSRVQSSGQRDIFEL